MSKKLALVEDDAEPIPQFLRSVTPTGPVTVETEEPASEVVAPLTEEPKPEPTRELSDSREGDLKAIEAEVLELCAEPIKPTSLAYEIRCGQVSKVREVEGIRNGYVDRLELLTARYEEAQGILGHKIADAEQALDYIANGIGHAAEG